MRTKIILLLTCMLWTFGCSTRDDWDNAGASSGVLNEFISLTAEHDTVPVGGSTKITARADGVLVRYIWSATLGDILGSGSQVTYVAPLCDCGNGHVNCKAQAGGRVLEKNITIYIVDD